MIDVHVLTIPTAAPYHAQCRRSIEDAVARAPFPVAVHYLDGELGHIGRGRARGYALGDYPYVTCVDDDDTLLPDAFANLAAALGAVPAAIYTPEMVRHKNGTLTRGLDRHHFMVLKREHLIDHENWPVYGDNAQLFAVDVGVVQLSEPGYVYRIHDQQASAVLRHQHIELGRRVKSMKDGQSTP